MDTQSLVACDWCECGYPVADMQEADTGDLYCPACAVLVFLLFSDDDAE